ncbi:MAG: nitroreductase [Coriobacteriia bacterium]|nr:nitroreductase [Coriobacteriia bacterium]
MELFDALNKRHSLRAFKTDPVSREKLDKLMEAASLAPSSMNEQPWRFFISTGESRREIGEILARNTAHVQEYLDVMGIKAEEHAERWFAELGDAPVVIACAVPRGDDDFALLNKHLAMGCAIQNIMLAATDIGVAVCPITFAYWVRDDLGEALGIPDDLDVVLILAVGFPAAEPKTTARNKDIAVYRD